VPEDEINIHFTGDAHAVSSAHNLLAALTDNVSQRGKIKGFLPDGITWRRVVDIEERALRSIITGLGGNSNAPMRETGFDIVTAWRSWPSWPFRQTSRTSGPASAGLWWVQRAMASP
jgi:formate--tetrahydrofolate ligase